MGVNEGVEIEVEMIGCSTTVAVVIVVVVGVFPSTGLPGAGVSPVGVVKPVDGLGVVNLLDSVAVVEGGFSTAGGGGGCGGGGSGGGGWGGRRERESEREWS